MYNDLDLSRIDITQANQMLDSVDWVSAFNGTTDVNQMLASFIAIMKEVFIVTAPKKRRVKKHPCRFPRAILKLIWRKRRGWKDSNKHGSKELYIKACKNLKVAINTFYAEREGQLSRKQNNGAFYRYINSRLGRKQFIPSCCKSASGQLLCTHEEIANAFGLEFSSNFGSVFASCCPKGDADDQMLNCTKEDVHKYLSATPDTVPRPDGISGHLLKSIRTSIALPLWKIFQQSLFQATFPIAWKDAIVQPIYKEKGDKHLPLSYRPVSLFSVLGKTLE